MKKHYHPAESRGHANHGWLDSWHSFSFANYFNPDKIQFGALRVLNDDTVDPGRGFGQHPHDNMEIISIPLEGVLSHGDNQGNKGMIRKNDVQVMSAGTGIVHSEMNGSQTDPVKFLQIWVFPNKKDVEPRYQQLTLNPRNRQNKLQQIISPDKNEEGAWIHQDAWFHIGHLEEKISTTYQFRKPDNGVYIFVISGKFNIDGQILNPRDALSVSEIEYFDIVPEETGEILIMEVPLNGFQ